MLAQGTLAGHLLECGCQVTGGYFAHPADEYRNLSAQQLVDISLPYAEISEHGDVIIAKPKHTGGELSVLTCGQQLLYEVGDPSFYITPDVVVDFTNVTFEGLTEHQVLAKGAKPGPLMRPEKLLRLVPHDYGWKAWGEISYGGAGCISRAAAAELMVRAWMEEVFPKSSERIWGYLIGVNSLLIAPIELSESKEALDVRLRMDGLFHEKEQAVGFTTEFEALYTNGPAGGGGISVGCRKETALDKVLVPREDTFWEMHTTAVDYIIAKMPSVRNLPPIYPPEEVQVPIPLSTLMPTMSKAPLPAPGGVEIPLYKFAHCRAGDKGNDVNFSLIPHSSRDLPRLQSIITKDWVKGVTRRLFLGHHSVQHIGKDTSGGQTSGLVHEKHVDSVGVEIYVAIGIHALNIVVRNALDGGVTCSRRLDRHGKSLSDLILCQTVTLPVAVNKTC
ncbi:hypothetical protein L7F22_065474 [Adiantum nelumboides]|nr:hypothetical protein [Adiantum nelumboides]